MKIRLFALGLLALALVGLARFPSRSTAQQDAPKIAPWLRAHSIAGKAIEALVILREQADVSQAEALPTKELKGRYVREALYRKATEAQADLLAWLDARHIEHRAFYIINAVWVKATPDVIETLAARADVTRIEANPTIKNNREPQLDQAELEAAAVALARERATALAPQTVELGVAATRAPEVWAQGFTGQGIVIGGADTGVKWDHAALINQYRGWNGATADHNFNWHDSIHAVPTNPCGSDTTAPCDDDNHGTHTLATAVGADTGNVNQVGMAPGAKWIACRNMNSGDGTPARYIECMEWFLAPYPIGGTTAQGDASKAPDITTNSWGCPASEGCGVNTLQAAVEAQRAAGIMMVVAAGNSGSSCSTVSDPPSFYAASYTVGAISASTGTIASFSSRGPVTADGSNRLKPEITAPGVTVRSALKSGGYGSLSGTSMATPHVAGAIALLWSARPAYRRQIQPTIDLLSQAAVHVSSTACSSSGVPNNVYGWGRLDIKAAVDAGTPANPPTIHKAFGAASIQAGNTTTVTLTLNNGNAANLLNASFTDTLVNLSAAGGAVTGTCAGITPATLTAGATALSFSGITILASGNCTVVFGITSNMAGTHANTTSGVTTTQSPTAGAASNTASLTVYAAPTIAKAFAPAMIAAGNTSNVTLTLTNANPLGLLAAFSDTLTNLSAVGGSNGGTCASLSTIVILPNATNLNFSGIILPSNGSCTVSFAVRGTVAGVQSNTTSGVTTDRTPTPGAPSNTANLTVNAPTATIAKAFSPATIPLGDRSTVTLTLGNASPLNVLASFSDTLVGMAAVGGGIGGSCATLNTISLPANATNLSFSGIVLPANGSCYVSFEIRGMLAGVQSNTTSGVTTDQTPVAGTPSNTATLTVVPTTVAKAFMPATIAAGGTSTVSLTLNNGNASAVLASLTDALMNMSAVGGPLGTTCASLATINLSAGATNVNLSGLVVPGNGSCVVTFPVTSNVMGTHPNTTSGVTMNSFSVAGPVSNTASLTVTASLQPTLARKVVRNDFDGDRKSDLARWNRESGEWQVTSSSDGVLHRIQLVEPTDKDEYVAVAGDFDGDHRTDAAIWRPRDGRWLIQYSLSGELVKAQFGLAGDVPMPADYDGDGLADFAVWRESENGLHILRSRDQVIQAIYLGEAGDTPVIGDFNGDEQTDIAVYGSGHWLLRDAATGMLSDVLFGQAGDAPMSSMAGDYDGDGLDDLMVRGYVRRSRDLVIEATPWSSLSAGESYVFGDYDGDGKEELAVWHTAKAAWDILFHR